MAKKNEKQKPKEDEDEEPHQATDKERMDKWRVDRHNRGPLTKPGNRKEDK